MRPFALRPLALALLLLSLQSSQAAAPGFSFHTRTDLRTSGSVAVVSADFNRDGIPDIAAMGATSIQVFLGTGHRQFAPVISVSLGGFPSSYDTLAVADINGDGKPDLIPSSGAMSPIFFGNGDGTFTRGPVIPTWGLPVVPADFNRDGKVDLAFAQGNTIQVLLGHGDGAFAPPVVFSGPAACLATGDFNGDGKPDLLGCDDGIAVYLGNGDGTFAPPVTSPTPSAPIFAAVGDLNNDGKQDVAAVAFHGNGSDPNLGPVYILYGKGDGTFSQALQLHTDIGTVFSVGIADLNGDGLPDLVAASINLEPTDFFTGSLVGTYFNNGPGQGFAHTAVYPVSFINQLPWATMIVADLDGDHIPTLWNAITAVSTFPRSSTMERGSCGTSPASRYPEKCPPGWCMALL